MGWDGCRCLGEGEDGLCEPCDVLLGVVSGEGNAQPGASFWNGWRADRLNEKAETFEVGGCGDRVLVGSEGDGNDGRREGIGGKAKKHAKVRPESTKVVAKGVAFWGGSYLEGGACSCGDRNGWGSGE